MSPVPKPQPLEVVVVRRETDDVTRTHALVKLLADLVVERRRSGGGSKR